MLSDKDGDEFLRGWSSQLALRTLEFSTADHARGSPGHAAGDLWDRRKVALQFLMARSPDVAARVLLSPLFCEQTSPVLKTQLSLMCQHALSMDQAFWDRNENDTPGKVSAEEVTFSATAMRGALETDGVLNIDDTRLGVRASSLLTKQAPPLDLRGHTSQLRTAAAERVRFAQELSSMAQPCRAPPPPPTARPSHAILSLRTKAPPPNMTEKAFLMRDCHDVSFTGVWPGPGAAPRLDAVERGLLAARPLPLIARTLQEQVEAEATPAVGGQRDGGTPFLAYDQNNDDDDQRCEEEVPSPATGETEHLPPPITEDHDDGDATTATPAPAPAHEKTVLAEDEELVIVGGKFEVRKKMKAKKKKDERPKPEVVMPTSTATTTTTTASHHDRKRSREEDPESTTGTHGVSSAAVDTPAPPAKSGVVSIAHTPLLTREELMAKLEEWSLPAALRDALRIGLEVGSVPPCQSHHVALPLTASETCEPTEPSVESRETHTK